MKLWLTGPLRSDSFVDTKFHNLILFFLNRRVGDSPIPGAGAYADTEVVITIYVRLSHLFQLNFEFFLY